jgi:hypothetical protein
MDPADPIEFYYTVIVPLTIFTSAAVFTVLVCRACEILRASRGV